MTRTYRIVQFVPDLFAGGRVPIGALLSEDGHTTLVRAEHVPGAGCLGGKRPYATMQLVLTAAARAAAQNSLPTGTGLHGLLDAETTVPSDVPDAARWLRSSILPRDSFMPEDGRSGRPQRASWGWNELRRSGLTHLVRKRFHPGSSIAGWMPFNSLLRPIAHWAFDQSSRVLLMEPIVPNLEVVVAEAREICTKFNAYRNLAQEAHNSQKAPRITPTFVSYITPGGSPRDLAPVREGLHQACDAVFDLGEPSSRLSFESLVREIGRPKDGQSEMTS